MSCVCAHATRANTNIDSLHSVTAIWLNKSNALRYKPHVLYACIIVAYDCGLRFGIESHTRLALAISLHCPYTLIKALATGRESPSAVIPCNLSWIALALTMFRVRAHTPNAMTQFKCSLFYVGVEWTQTTRESFGVHVHFVRSVNFEHWTHANALLSLRDSSNRSNTSSAWETSPP